MTQEVVERALRLVKDPGLFRTLLARIKQMCSSFDRRPVLMEVCGSHTWAISHTGIRSLLRDEVDLISGPGCPVCVTAPGEIQQMIEISYRPGVIVVSYGDLIRVRSPRGSLEESRARGSRVQVVYSAVDAVRIAEDNPENEVVFLGIGFETTAPASAAAILTAIEGNVGNFSVYSAHKIMPPALQAILSSGDSRIDGLILPGHVSAVTGRRYFDFISAYGVPSVIAGFEACDILYAILRLLEKIKTGDFSVENAYPRAVTETGNQRALSYMREVFTPGDTVWRGLGSIPASGLRINPAYSRFDAVARFGLPAAPEIPGPPGCSCAEVLCGRKVPEQCPLFVRLCTPSNPVGPCMVSSEGSCRAHYLFDHG